MRLAMSEHHELYDDHKWHEQMNECAFPYTANGKCANLVWVFSGMEDVISYGHTLRAIHRGCGFHTIHHVCRLSDTLAQPCRSDHSRWGTHIKIQRHSNNRQEPQNLIEPSYVAMKPLLLSLCEWKE